MVPEATVRRVLQRPESVVTASFRPAGKSRLHFSLVPFFSGPAARTPESQNPPIAVPGEHIRAVHPGNPPAWCLPAGLPGPELTAGEEVIWLGWLRLPLSFCSSLSIKLPKSSDFIVVLKWHVFFLNGSVHQRLPTKEQQRAKRNNNRRKACSTSSHLRKCFTGTAEQDPTVKKSSPSDVHSVYPPTRSHNELWRLATHFSL